MAVTVLFELQLQADKVDTLIQTMKEILPDTRGYDGCIGVEVVQNQDEPANIVLIQKWETRPHYEKYLAWRTETGVVEQLGTLVAAPPSIKFFDTKDA